MQGIGRERPAGEIAPIGTYGATFSGSPCSVPLHPAGSAHGRLSQGSYIPFLYGQGLEKWIRLPPRVGKVCPLLRLVRTVM